MHSTPLLNKPVFYGSELANAGFIALVVLHLIPAALAVGASFIALTQRKGSARHIQWGKVFVWSMVATATTGIVLDIIRLSFFVTENHQKYMDYSMPSSYPARFAFLYVAFCIFYLVRVATDPRNLIRSLPTTKKPATRIIPTMLLLVGLYLTFLIYRHYNPWTGALWMVWTFMVLVFVTNFLPTLKNNLKPFGIHQHRLSMMSLAAFSWWGALQGFGPALVMLVTGVDNSAGTYTGNQTGSYDPAFWFFLLAWLPPFALGGFLIYQFTAKASQSKPAKMT